MGSLEGGTNTAVSTFAPNLPGRGHHSVFPAENRPHAAPASEVLGTYYFPPHPNTSFTRSGTTFYVLTAHSSRSDSSLGARSAA